MANPKPDRSGNSPFPPGCLLDLMLSGVRDDAIKLTKDLDQIREDFNDANFSFRASLREHRRTLGHLRNRLNRAQSEGKQTLHVLVPSRFFLEPFLLTMTILHYGSPTILIPEMNHLQVLTKLPAPKMKSLLYRQNLTIIKGDF